MSILISLQISHSFFNLSYCRIIFTSLYKRRIRIEDLFGSFDNLKLGYVSQQKFRSVVGQTGLPLSSQEIDFILCAFKVEGMEDMFNYRQFCHQLNKTELQRKPIDNGKPRVSALPDPSSITQTLNESEQKKLNEILQRMKNVVISRRMNIIEQFSDYDKAPHKNYITKQQFKQCIARLGLTTSAYELDLLCKKFKCTDLEDMNYKAFCHEMDNNV